MNAKTTYLTLISLAVGAASLAPSAALAERDNGFNRDRQQQTESKQYKQRQETNRQQTIGTTPQRQQQGSQPRYERSTPQRVQQPARQQSQQLNRQRSGPGNQPRVGQSAPQRVQQPAQRQNQQFNRQRSEPNQRPHAVQPAPQRIERTAPQRVQQHNRQFERNAPQRVERQAQPRVERRSYQHRRSTAPERRHVETRRSFHVKPPHVTVRHVYRPVQRNRYYHGIHVYRHYGHAYPGFGFYYDDADALRWLAFTAVTLAIVNQLDVQQQRTYEQALIRATTADIGDTIYWEDRYSSGWVTVTDIWYDISGRQCREMEQSVSSVGRTESSFITVCQRADGVWVIPAR